ncbi:hypothetical protein ACN42_g569 [Penicillium freii]|uniref:SH3 domain-containing protein n=1 Tax=Penicillium freii TaxID=48697 RepID=A0A124GT93_PENFR|nr:hypothetical protein ACN42_g569 [Penicillium freii]
MSSTIAQGIAGPLNADWKPSQPSAAPAGHKDLNNNDQGRTFGQQASWQATQVAKNIPSQQAPSNTQDDGQYHPNQPMPQTPQLGKALDATNQETTLGQQLSPNNQAPPITQDDGQYHPNQFKPQTPPQLGKALDATNEETTLGQQLSPNHQAPPITQDDGQYHPNSAGGKESPSTLSNDQYNTQQQPAKDQSQMNQAFTQTQHGPSINAYDTQQLDWGQVDPAGESWNSAVDATQSPTPTQLDPTGHATSTSAPSMPTSSEPGSSASSPAARAGIALSVCAAVALIALLILFPLYKRRKRLQKALGGKEKEVIVHEPPLKGATQPLNVFISKVCSHSARLALLIPAFMRPKRQTSNPTVCFGDTHIGREINNDTIVSHKVPRTKTCPAPHYSPPISVSSWETQLSTSRPNSPLAQAEDAKQEQTGSPNPDHENSLGTLENLSVGNLVAANPLVTNIYTVEIDYSSRRAGQLDVQAGQRLCVMQVFDNGWAMGVRLDCPEAGLVPRSHLSAEPDSQPLRRTGEQRKSIRHHSFNQRAFHSLGSRFYSLFSPSAQEPHSSSPV